MKYSFYSKITQAIKNFFSKAWDEKTSLSNRKFMATTWHVYLIASLLSEQFFELPTPDKLFLSSLTGMIWGFYFLRKKDNENPLETKKYPLLGVNDNSSDIPNPATDQINTAYK